MPGSEEEEEEEALRALERGWNEVDMVYDDVDDTDDIDPWQDVALEEGAGASRAA